MTAVFTQLHWLRPDWFWALAALPLLVWWWQRRQSRANVWRQAVDPHLLPHLLERRASSRTWMAAAIAALAFVISVVAMAGPSLRETQQPLWSQKSPLVVAVDLSSSSRAADTPPSRIARARAKIANLLGDRRDGQVGLVAWAGEAFTVAPLTPDKANVALFLDALDPEVMPVDGQRPDYAIAWSARLLAQAGFQDGTILLLTDHATPIALTEAAKVHARGYTVSVIGMGAAEGAPYRSSEGEIVVARRDDASLQRLADAGGGRYVALSDDNADLLRLDLLDPRNGAVEGEDSGRSVTTRQDDGYWLLLPLMVLALLAFRRGTPILVVLVCLWLPGQAVHASELWQRPDQRAHQTMEEAAKAYRRGEFGAAAELYSGVKSPDADYNRGNALARQGDYAEALKAYDRALKASPELADAVANRQAVEAAMKRQPPPGSKSSSEQNQDKGEQGQGGQSQSGEAQSSDEPGDDSKGQSQKREDAGNADGKAYDGSGDEAEKTPAAQASDSADDRTDRSSSAPAESDTGGDDLAAADARAQQAADEAQRERMRDALEQGGRGNEEAVKPAQGEAGPESAEERERRIANEAWLRRIPDDPGGLLRRKFRIEYERRQQEGSVY